MSTAAAVSAMQLRQSIGALLNRVQYAGERIIVARQGKPVAALVGWPELQRIECLIDDDRRTVTILIVGKRGDDEI